MTGIMDALKLEHANIAMLLDLLEDELAEGDEIDRDLVQAITDYLLTYPDQYHHPKEDLVYRALLAADPGSGAALDDLESEHVELAERTREVAFAAARVRNNGDETGRWFDQLVRNFLGYYRQHMAKEDSGFFPLAERVLGPEALGDLETQLSDVSDPLFDPHAADRLARLKSRVAG